MPILDDFSQLVNELQCIYHVGGCVNATATRTYLEKVCQWEEYDGYEFCWCGSDAAELLDMQSTNQRLTFDRYSMMPLNIPHSNSILATESLMQIKELLLTNYRGITSMHLRFHESLNVFFGINGAGKSTVLDATALMLSWAQARTKHITTSGRQLSESDITNGLPSSSITIRCEHDSKLVEWKLSKSRKGHPLPEEQRSFLQNLNGFCRQLQEEIAAKAEKVDIPLFVYYPVNRAVLDIPLRIRKKHRFELLSAYDDSLISGANFRTFFEWFREREDLENENRRFLNTDDKPEGFEFPDSQLDAVRIALGKVLPNFHNLTVRRDPLRMEVQKKNKRVTVTQLSDGEKCLIAMVGDLARRIAIANPTRNTPLEGKGVVLIDEIDLHLHPQWQQMILPKLLSTFPGCQFIVSTRSAHVITHVHPESLFEMEQMEAGITAEHPAESYGKNAERILEDLMGMETTRPERVSAELRQVYDAIERSELSEAKRIIEKLRSEIGADPDLSKAELIIRRKELTGK